MCPLLSLAPKLFCRMHPQERAFRDLAAVITRVMNQFYVYEQLPRTYGSGRRLYPAEIYTIEAIGRHPQINVTRLAEHLGITKGAVSQAIAKLVRKGLVRKTGGPDNAKEVRLELTPRGRTAFGYLDRHYHLFYQASVAYYGAALSGKLKTFRKLFEEFGEYFSELVREVPVDYPPTEQRRARHSLARREWP